MTWVDDAVDVNEVHTPESKIYGKRLHLAQSLLDFLSASCVECVEFKVAFFRTIDMVYIIVSITTKADSGFSMYFWNIKRLRYELAAGSLRNIDGVLYFPAHTDNRKKSVHPKVRAIASSWPFVEQSLGTQSRFFRGEEFTI